MSRPWQHIFNLWIFVDCVCSYVLHTSSTKSDVFRWKTGVHIESHANTMAAAVSCATAVLVLCADAERCCCCGMLVWFNCPQRVPLLCRLGTYAAPNVLSWRRRKLLKLACSNNECTFYFYFFSCTFGGAYLTRVHHHTSIITYCKVNDSCLFEHGCRRQIERVKPSLHTCDDQPTT